jgi:hypothetical protein
MLINVLVQQFSSSQLHFERPQENQMNTVVFDHGSKFFTFPIFLSAKVATFFDEQFGYYQYLDQGETVAYAGTNHHVRSIVQIQGDNLKVLQTITYAVSFRYHTRGQQKPIKSPRSLFHINMAGDAKKPEKASTAKLLLLIAGWCIPAPPP